jgi:hypothetical protein
MPKSKLELHAEQLVERVMNGEVGLNDAIEDLNRRLEVFDRVKEHRDKLLSARRALLGVGSRTTSSGGSRITQDEVAQYVGANAGEDGLSVADIASGLSTSEAVVRGHLSRGKDRFTKIDNHWFVRDPEKDTEVEDDEGDEDDDD